MMPLKHRDRNSRQFEAAPALAGGQREVDGGSCGEDAGGVVASGHIGALPAPPSPPARPAPCRHMRYPIPQRIALNRVPEKLAVLLIPAHLHRNVQAPRSE